MNNTEAIHKLEFMRDAYQKLIDENVDEGRFVGTDVTGTWKSDTPLNKVYAEHVEALDMAISAMKKLEQDMWIPCKERPPEEDGRYLITEKTDGTKVQEGYFCRTRDGEPYWGYLHVIAWRPLPEAYTEEES